MVAGTGAGATAATAEVETGPPGDGEQEGIEIGRAPMLMVVVVMVCGEATDDDNRRNIPTRD